MEKERTQSLNFWSNFEPMFPPEDGQNWKKSGAEKLQSLGYPKI